MQAIRIVFVAVDIEDWSYDSTLGDSPCRELIIDILEEVVVGESVLGCAAGARGLVVDARPDHNILTASGDRGADAKHKAPLKSIHESC